MGGGVGVDMKERETTIRKKVPLNHAGLESLHAVPLRGEGSCGVGGASRDSTGFAAMEEGLISCETAYPTWRQRA